MSTSATTKNEGALPSPGHVFQDEGTDDLEDLPSSLVLSLDAVLVLGGGVPSSLEEPPVFIQRRCDVAAKVVRKHQELLASNKEQQPLPILTLSAGTAHMPQLMSADGLPIWEATSSAAYLLKHHGFLGEDTFYCETTSYDTISNAFFSRTSHTEVVGWRRLLIITSEFHMDRSRAIFDWIFGVSPPVVHPYELYYVSCENVGMTEEAIQARKEHEARGLRNVQNHLIPHYTTLKDVWLFINQKHDFYAASPMVKRIKNTKAKVSEDNQALKESYGASRKTNNGPHSS